MKKILRHVKSLITAALKIDDRSLILKAGVFDHEYYLSQYDDVRKAKMDPLVHFIKYGANEGRNPNRVFDTRYFVNTYMAKKGSKKPVNPLVFYLKNNKKKFNSLSGSFDVQFYLTSYPDVTKTDKDPLSHYLNYGIKEGRKGCASIYDAASTSGKNNYLNSQFPHWIDVRACQVSIIVPIYNAFDEVKECIYSLLQHVNFSVDKIVFINDCSTDPRIQMLLNALADRPNIRVLENKENLGYTKSVNLGLAQCEDSDVVLLNSDTEVTPNWLRNLKLAANEDGKIGTVTAVSNGAGAFSVPQAGLHDLPIGFSAGAFARLVQTCGPHERVEVPTGNGFCLYIKRRLLDKIENFDESRFPRGYGEENFFCMLAIDKGFRNVVDPNTFVFHVRSASFKDEKEQLIEEGVNTVASVFPEYRSIVKMIGNSRSFTKARKKISTNVAKKQSPLNFSKPKILYVISTRTGGTPQTNHDLMRGVADCFNSIAIACNSKKIEVLEATKNSYRTIEEFELNDPILFAYHKSHEYDAILKWILFKYSIELVHIRHLAWQSLNIIEVCKSMGLKVVNSFHDFYTVCPSVNLIDDEGNFYPNGVTVHAKNPLWNDATCFNFTEDSSKRWKQKMESVLCHADAHVTTCNSAKDIISQNFPSLFQDSHDDAFHVIPHGRDFSGFEKLAKKPKISEPLRVLLPGNISLAKGSETFKTIKNLDKKGAIEFHVLGTCGKDLKPYVHYHGAYERRNFIDRVNEIKPHIAAIFSVWPETYCHTLTECWACGVPVMGVDLGAVGDRIRNHGGGWLVPNDVEAIYEQLLSIDGDNWSEKLKQVDVWQDTYGKDNTIKYMAIKYIDLYKQLLTADIQEIPNKLKKVGLVLKGTYPDVPATAYVRMVDWAQVFANKYDLPTEFIDGRQILSTNVSKYSHIIVQRDAIPDSYVDQFIESLMNYNVLFTLELDDDLFNVPCSVDLTGHYNNYRSSLEKLAKNANCVTVSCHSLADICKLYSNNVEVRANKISRERWLENSVRAHSVIKNSANTKNINIIYFGSKTHSNDYEFLIRSLELAVARGRSVSLYVVGITDEKESAPDFVKFLEPPDARYDVFVDWLRAQADSFDLGVAPLMDTEFSRKKSYLKVLEYLAVGLPVYCSEVGPYKALKGKKHITLLKNEPEIWAEGIVSFCNNEDEVKLDDDYLIK